ncbi:MAG: hypothetical protein JW384_02642 [Nitrosomonadaceae bacterium]|nr:hypothetical protein [Nitrosomonadaceae bacterium]
MKRFVKKHIFGDDVVPTWTWIMDVARWFYDHDREEYRKLTKRHHSTRYPRGSDKIFKGMSVCLDADAAHLEYGDVHHSPTCAFYYDRGDSGYSAPQFEIQPIGRSGKVYTMYKLTSVVTGLRSTCTRHLPFTVSSGKRDWNSHVGNVIYRAKDNFLPAGKTELCTGSGWDKDKGCPLLMDDSTGKIGDHVTAQNCHDHICERDLGQKEYFERGPRFLAGETTVKGWLRSLATPPMFERKGETRPLWDVKKTLALAGEVLESLVKTQREFDGLQMAVRYMPLRHLLDLPAYYNPGHHERSPGWFAERKHCVFQIGTGDWVKTNLSWGVTAGYSDGAYWVPRDDRYVQDMTGWKIEDIEASRTAGILPMELSRIDAMRPLYVDWPVLHLDFGNVRVQSNDPEFSHKRDGFSRERGLATNGFSLQLVPYLDRDVAKVVYSGKIEGHESLPQVIGGLYKIKGTDTTTRGKFLNSAVTEASPATMLDEVHSQYVIEAIPMY